MKSQSAFGLNLKWLRVSAMSREHTRAVDHHGVRP
jgi:hypothetical protein